MPLEKICKQLNTPVEESNPSVFRDSNRDIYIAYITKSTITSGINTK